MLKYMFAERSTAFSALSINTSATFQYIIAPQSQGNWVIQSIQMQAFLKATQVGSTNCKCPKKQHIQQTTRHDFILKGVIFFRLEISHQRQHLCIRI